MADSKRLVEIAIKATTGEAKSGIQGLTKELTGLDAKQVAVAASAVAMGVAIVAGLKKATDAIVNLAKETSAIGDSFDKMSARTSLSVKTLSEWSYVAGIAGSNIGSVERGVQSMIRLMRDSQEGLSTAKRAWADLGVTVTNADGSLRDVNDVLYDSRNALSMISNDAEASALAMEIFGRAGKEIIPVLRLSNEEFDSQIQLAEKLHGVYTEKFTKSAAAFVDAQLNVKTASDGAKIAMAAAINPTLTDFYNGLALAIGGVASALDSVNNSLNGSNLDAFAKKYANDPFASLMFGLPGADGGPDSYSGKGQDSAGVADRTAKLKAQNEEWRAQLLIRQQLADLDSILIDQSTKDTSAAYFGNGESFGIPADAQDAIAALVDIPTTNGFTITDEQLKAWEDQLAMIEASKQALRDFGEGFAQVGAQGISTMLGLREGEFMMAQALKNEVAAALETVIQKLIMVKLLNPFFGFLGLAEGGEVPGMAAGGRVPGARVMHAAAGMIVPNVGQAGLDSVPIWAMPGEGVIKRDTMAKLDSFLNASANAAPVGDITGSGAASVVNVNYNIARPVSYRDHLDLGENAVAAQRAASRRVL